MKNEHTTKNEEHHWTSEEKLKWLGYGEWVEELDSIEIEYLGYEAIVIRVLQREPFSKVESYFGGNFCAHVRIPENHPLYGSKEIDIDCHGGINLNEFHEEHWIGFDCAHAIDYIPTFELKIKQHKELFPIPKGLENSHFFTPVYRNMQYCIDECKKIIDQLINDTEKWEEIKQSKKKSINS